MTFAIASLNLANRTFQLFENNHGHAGIGISMRFNSDTHPFRAEYGGPNIIYGNALVSKNEDELVMLYHQLNTDQSMSAGGAEVKLSLTKKDLVVMELHWCWLTGAVGSGISIWHHVD